MDQAAAVANAARPQVAPSEANRAAALQPLAQIMEDKSALTAPETPAAAPPSSLVPRFAPTPRNPANRLWAQKAQRDLFIQHLENWASKHDSSPYFHGSISLPPQGTFSREEVELGKSVNCILISTSSGTRDNVVIRLFRSHRNNDDARHRSDPGTKHFAVNRATGGQDQVNIARSRREKTDAQRDQRKTSYYLVIRSGSGWVPAHEYFNKHYFAHPRKLDPPEVPCKPSWVDLLDVIASPQRAHFASPIVIPSVNTVNLTNTHGQAEDSRTSTGLRVQNSPLHRSRRNESILATKYTVPISPLFRPFSRLPQELQDEILLQAVGYTRRISLACTRQVKNSPKYNEAPISISKLFQISKTINQYMVPHVLSTTNFHFGITGFTKFLWQLGPVNRASLKHVTFHFGKQSLLHCIRWTAPDPVYELFEPPVVTQPTSLMYFWRCQLQDLVKELDLSTLTIDTSGVPVADVAMLVRILGTAVGNVERIRIIDNFRREVCLVEEHAENVQDLYTRFPDLPRLTWRELCQQYHSDYRRNRWHMRELWTMHGDANLEALDRWMDKDKVFFDF